MEFKEAVKNSVDIDPCEEEDESVIQKIKEIKVLPPIRNKSNTLPQISYTPNRVWGGSVNSYLDTINRDSIIDEDIITGRRADFLGNKKSISMLRVKKRMVQWNPMNTDTKGTRRSIGIIRASVLSGLSEKRPRHMFYRYKD